MKFPRFIGKARRRFSPHIGRFLIAAVCVCAAEAGVCQGSGYAGSVDAPEAEVLKAVHWVLNDSIIHGTYSYEKEKQLKGAKPADAAPVFGERPEAGKVFFKVDENVLAPRHFKETADLGTIYVRYIVRGTGAGTTALQVDAVYVEKNRRRQHASDGSVEQAEFQAIRERLEKIKAEERPLAPAADAPSAEMPAVGIGSAPASVLPSAISPQELEKKVEDLKHKVEMRTAAGGAALKAAPFRTAATLQPLPEKADLLVVIVTKYWYGIETADGHRGWVHRSQLEALP